jgi:hypothetical protein
MIENILNITKTEEESCAEFDAFIESTGLFLIEKEVTGKYLFGCNNTDGKTPRIDRILIPKSKASVERKLTTGPIGVEIKAVNSSLKMGRPICQAMDYRSASFRIFHGWANIDCILDSVFLFPMQEQSGPVVSIMANYRIGVAHIGYGDQMFFKLASTNVLKLTRNSQNFYINMTTSAMGRKVGSR